MNKWIGKGRLTKDPNIRHTPNGSAVATFTLACDRRKSKNAPQNAPTADFISCVAWDKLAKTIGEYCGKGKEIAVEARIQTRNYEKNGAKVYVTEAVIEHMEFCGKKSDGGNPNGGYQQNNGYQQGGYPPPSGQYGEPVPDEEIPF